MSQCKPDGKAGSTGLRLARQTSVVWTRTATAEHPYEAWVAGCRWVVRIGDFPAEPLYTLVVDGEELGSFDDWPEVWTRPTA